MLVAPGRLGRPAPARSAVGPGAREGRTPTRPSSTVRGYFDRAAREAGVAGLVPHELRHTAASLAIASGASVKAVQRMLGHASATLTLDRYGHLFPDEMDALAASLDNAMRGSGVVPMWSQDESSVSREERSESKTGSDLRK